MPHRRFLIITVSVLLLTSASLAFAIGGGSGGSVGNCSADTWSCTNWSTCSSKGTQTRTCSLTYDCPTATTPKPSTEQACESPQPAEPIPNDPSANQNVAPSTQTNATTNPPSTNVECTEDTWTCSDWSTACDTNGLQSRSCNVTNDCAVAATPSPETARPCPKLQCGDKSTIRERIFCRLNLAPAGIARELEVQYLPEECRAVSDATKRDECITYYKSYQPCWTQPAGESHFACAKNVLKLGPVISEEVKTCQGKKGQDQVDCKQQIRHKVFDFIKFRFYDLEQRAEDLGNRGASLEAIADFETAVEQQKQAFDQATTKAERRQIILNVRQAWQQFITMVRSQIT